MERLSAVLLLFSVLPSNPFTMVLRTVRLFCDVALPGPTARMPYNGYPPSVADCPVSTLFPVWVKSIKPTLTFWLNAPTTWTSAVFSALNAWLQLAVLSMMIKMFGATGLMAGFCMNRSVSSFTGSKDCEYAVPIASAKSSEIAVRTNGLVRMIFTPFKADSKVRWLKISNAIACRQGKFRPLVYGRLRAAQCVGRVGLKIPIRKFRRDVLRPAVTRCHGVELASRHRDRHVEAIDGRSHEYGRRRKCRRIGDFLLDRFLYGGLQFSQNLGVADDSQVN